MHAFAIKKRATNALELLHGREDESDDGEEYAAVQQEGDEARLVAVVVWFVLSEGVEILPPRPHSIFTQDANRSR